MTRKTNFIMVLLIIINVALVFAIINMRETSNINVNEIYVDAKEKILFVGDSITDGYDVISYFNYKDKTIINSGIGGYKTTNIINRFYNVVEQHKADKLFLMIGTNDLDTKTTRDTIVINIQKIIEKIKEKTPNTKIYYETVYPVNNSVKSVGKRNNEDIRYINEEMKKYCEENNITYIDVYSILVDDNDKLKVNYTYDGLHLTEEGYIEVTKLLRPYVEE